ncbi:MAG: hypothetical protein H6Q89_2400 [Myxococcaceae bacterium]|nr:hypothetical protein [Myxococcaceae bacterium]
MGRTLWLALALVGSGCATNLSALQTAKTLRPGQIRIGGGVGLYVPAGQVVNAIGEGVNLAKSGVNAATARENFTVSREDQEKLLTTAFALAVLPPSTSWEINARYGVVDNLDVGVRWGLNALRADAKYRLLHGGGREGEGEGGRKSFDLAIGIGVSKYFFSNPVLEALEKVKLVSFSRFDVEVPIYLSADFNPYFGIYFSPKYVYSRTSVEMKLLEFAEACGCIEEKYQLPTTVDMHFVGATGGLRAGLPRLSFFFELTAGNTFVNPMILGKERNLGGVTLYPSLGLAGTFR